MKKCLLNFNILMFIFVLLISTSCKKDTDLLEDFQYDDFVKSGDYLGDYFPTEGWRECDARKVGMDIELLTMMNDSITDMVEMGYKFHSVLITRKGYIVAEKHYDSLRQGDRLHELQSVTKSFTSTLIGIAIKEGYIEGTDVKMLDYFQDYEIDNMNLQ